MVRDGVKNTELAQRLTDMGLPETEASVQVRSTGSISSLFHVGRFARDWRPYAAIGLIVPILYGVFLTPKPPSLLTEAEQPRLYHAPYYPGGANCRPEAMARTLGGPGYKRQAEKCAEAYENKASEREGIFQAARSAKAAEQVAIITYSQAVTGAWTFVILILALGASVWAALAARSAAETADRTLEHARTSAEQQFRAYLGIRSAWLSIGDNRVWHFKLMNYGQTPARNVVVNVTTHISNTTKDQKYEYGLVDPDFPWIGQVPLPAPVFVKKAFTGEILVRIDIDYDDDFKGRWRRSQEFQYAQGIAQIGDANSGQIDLHLVAGSSSERKREDGDA